MVKVLKILEKIVGVNGETLDDYKSQGYKLVGQTGRFQYYRSGNSFIIYSIKQKEVLRQFDITPYK